MDRRSMERPSIDKGVEVKSQQSLPQRNTAREVPATHRKIVFSDPVAFRYLEEDDCTTVVDRLTRIHGYELYVVEQWVCSRTHPTFLICSYTGDNTHSILVNVLAIPKDEKQWSQRLKVYFQAVSQFHAREQETSLGSLYVTNLSSFPSALTVISVPDGDVKKHKDELIVNENLKRMGCAGRAAITLQDPPASTVAKYYHLYATSEAVPITKSVIELVKICQIALVLYGKLNIVYADGLLCDITERAISDWWDDIGTEFHNVEPSDGVFGPTTVAALLGLLVGAHNRLKSAGIAIGKDVFDVVAMKRSIGHFQKGYRINRSRRLDRDTLDRLHRATAKIASGEGWGVPRAVKSTVAELSGKGGEMVMGMVGAKDKAAIADIETLDIDRFAELASGARLRWLWQGKPMKTAVSDVFARQSDDYKAKLANNDDGGTFLWTNTSRDPKYDNDDENLASGGHNHTDRRLGRLRDAVGISTKKVRHPRIHQVADEFSDSEGVSSDTKTMKHNKAHEKHIHHHVQSPASSRGRTSFEYPQDPKPAMNLALAVSETAPTPIHSSSHQLKPARDPIESTSPPYREQLRGADALTGESPTRRRIRHDLDQIHEEIQAEVYQKFASEFYHLPTSTALSRTLSATDPKEIGFREERVIGLPRRLSSGIIDELSSLTTLDELHAEDKSLRTSRLPFLTQLTGKEAEITQLQELTEKLLHLEKALLPYAQSESQQVATFDLSTRDSLEDLNNTYYGGLDRYQTLQATSADLIAREKASLNDALKKIEMLGQKLDYELNSLQSRMQEVEDGTVDFERSVREIEDRIQSLVHDGHGDKAGIPWLQRLFNFLGK